MNLFKFKMEKTIFLICLLIMEGRSLTEDEMEAKFIALKEEFFQDLEIKLETLNQDVDHLKIVTKMIRIESCPDMARHGIVESGYYGLNLGSIGSPTKGFCNFQEGKFLSLFHLSIPISCTMDRSIPL